MPIPSSLHRYFWDADIEKLDTREHKGYIIGRLLEMGDIAGARWMLSQYSSDEIRHVLNASRALSLKSRTFWTSRLEIDFSHDADA